MKTIYQCEKCGSTFEDYDAARACERIHLQIDQFPDYSNYNEYATYSKDGQLPETIKLGAKDWKDGDYKVTWAVYKLVKVDKELSKVKTAEWIAERAKDEQEHIARQKAKAAMVEALAEVEGIADLSYWKISEIYKEKFGSEYQQ